MAVATLAPNPEDNIFTGVLGVLMHGVYGLKRIQEECASVWQTEHIKTRAVRSPDDGRSMLVLAVEVYTRPNEDLRPQGKVLQQLIDIMKRAGFDEPPRWHCIYVSE
ncbi:hypothetical protein BDN70DRAFT_884051 [Pholiota conissans]|uniref:Uncharacterized protein n=1 Tax=Pholiota conissans TaxID=109636 RepID=A0A9P5YUV8_9AGAR|nr:hypothetical protein BDN70DRAFT_884051 [Pholiota conissans]